MRHTGLLSLTLLICAASFGADEKTVALGDKSVVPPEGWKFSEPSNRMRLAQAAIPKAEGDSEGGELTVFSLGGSVDANLERWVGQFGGKEALKDKRSLKTASGKDATIVEIEGTLTAMSPAGGKAEPKEGMKMLGALIVTDAAQFQFKLTGPKKTIDANKAAFEKMIESFK
jgi:hypothetical protein